ncbi:flippase-like domain-containing protein [Rhodocaloribacter litoris]|uniref:lysylphosphatidylglycerol synthase transmembrane domain-containing protein n=1 Tax=Rhodocaloribacter litoris TaxID=2558931 RepID=UPI0014241060|nr:lysylphosphatidylglycerol synthase transmembrane domain-containing protein [Rhodocaloribacter litoris]QXD15214.1 flippase-like domain-containing protein [Rhodocaloribacter litoris]GIV60423.1 MAG: TIGR00374 family protein [Rhodothermaceae bacterium]
MPDPSSTLQEAPVPEAQAGEQVPSPPPFSWLSLLWPLLLSLGVLLVIGYFTFSPDDFVLMLDTLDPVMIGLALAMVVLRVLFGGWRLHFVSHGRLDFMAATRGQLAWDFASNMTPSLVGGAPLAAFYIARDSKSSRRGAVAVGEVGAWMLFVMILDQIWFALSVPLVLTATVFIEVIPASLGRVGFWTTVTYLLGFMLWTTVFAYATLVRPELLDRFTRFVFRIKGLRRFRERVTREMQQYQRRARILRSQPPVFYLYGFLLTLGTWLARYFLIVFIVWSVVPDVDVLLAFFRTAALTLSSLILPTPGGAGGIEGLYVLFLGPLMAKGMVVPTLLVWRILGYYIFLFFGVFVTTHTVHKTLRFRRRQARLGTNGHPAAEKTGAEAPPADPPAG